MKRFILKSFIFLLPFTLVFCFSELFFTSNKGDLIRIGYVADINNYNSHNVFNKEDIGSIDFTRLSGLDLKQNHKFKTLIIGDSYSTLEKKGYPNYLAKGGVNSVLYFDNFLTKPNPIESVYSILNGDLLDKVKIDYLIFESVEREFVNRALDVETNNSFKIDSIGIIKDKHEKNELKLESEEEKFFSNRMFLFSYYNIAYLFDDNAFKSETYKVKTTKSLFSNNKNELLFFHNDLRFLKINSDIKNVSKVNDVMNDLSKKLNEKGIKLIVIPGPDKYDAYYDYILNKSSYKKPLFFDHLNSMKKDYLYINSKKIIDQLVKSKKDVYYYDDTHWSPWATKSIAKEINNIIKNSENNNNSSVSKINSELIK